MLEAEERNPLAKCQSGLLKGGELATAWRAPRCPFVHDDRIPTQLLHARVEVALAPADQLVCLVVQRLQLRRGTGESPLDLSGRRRLALRLGFAATCKENGGQEDWNCDSHAGKASHSGFGNH